MPPRVNNQLTIPLKRKEPSPSTTVTAAAAASDAAVVTDSTVTVTTGAGLGMSTTPTESVEQVNNNKITAPLQVKGIYAISTSHSSASATGLIVNESESDRPHKKSKKSAVSGQVNRESAKVNVDLMISTSESESQTGVRMALRNTVTDSELGPGLVEDDHPAAAMIDLTDPDVDFESKSYSGVSSDISSSASASTSSTRDRSSEAVDMKVIQTTKRVQFGTTSTPMPSAAIETSRALSIQAIAPPISSSSAASSSVSGPTVIRLSTPPRKSTIANSNFKHVWNVNAEKTTSPTKMNNKSYLKKLPLFDLFEKGHEKPGQICKGQCRIRIVGFRTAQGNITTLPFFNSCIEPVANSFGTGTHLCSKVVTRELVLKPESDAKFNLDEDNHNDLETEPEYVYSCKEGHTNGDWKERYLVRVSIEQAPCAEAGPGNSKAYSKFNLLAKDEAISQNAVDFKSSAGIAHRTDGLYDATMMQDAADIVFGCTAPEFAAMDSDQQARIMQKVIDQRTPFYAEMKIGFTNAFGYQIDVLSTIDRDYGYQIESESHHSIFNRLGLTQSTSSVTRALPAPASANTSAAATVLPNQPRIPSESEPVTVTGNNESYPYNHDGYPDDRDHHDDDAFQVTDADYVHLPVPGDGNCAWYAIIIGFLCPVVENNEEFQRRLSILTHPPSTHGLTSIVNPVVAFPPPIPPQFLSRNVPDEESLHSLLREYLRYVAVKPRRRVTVKSDPRLYAWPGFGNTLSNSGQLDSIDINSINRCDMWLRHGPQTSATHLSIDRRCAAAVQYLTELQLYLRQLVFHYRTRFEEFRFRMNEFTENDIKGASPPGYLARTNKSTTQTGLTLDLRSSQNTNSTTTLIALIKNGYRNQSFTSIDCIEVAASLFRMKIFVEWECATSTPNSSFVEVFVPRTATTLTAAASDSDLSQFSRCSSDSPLSLRQCSTASCTSHVDVILHFCRADGNATDSNKNHFEARMHPACLQINWKKHDSPYMDPGALIYSRRPMHVRSRSRVELPLPNRVVPPSRSQIDTQSESERLQQESPSNHGVSDARNVKEVIPIRRRFSQEEKKRLIALFNMNLISTQVEHLYNVRTLAESFSSETGALPCSVQQIWKWCNHYQTRMGIRPKRSHELSTSLEPSKDDHGISRTIASTRAQPAPTPNVNVNDMFHKSKLIRDAMVHFWTETGIHRFVQFRNHINKSDMNATAAATEAAVVLRHELGPPVSNDVKRRCIRQYNRYMDPTLPILLCGCCGVQELPNVSFTQQESRTAQNRQRSLISLSELSVLRLNEEEVRGFESKSSEVQKAYSITKVRRHLVEPLTQKQQQQQQPTSHAYDSDRYLIHGSPNRIESDINSLELAIDHDSIQESESDTRANDQHDWAYFHLHPNLVTYVTESDSVAGHNQSVRSNATATAAFAVRIPHIRLCSDCYGKLFPTSGEPSIPKYCLAAGFDFGQPERMGLPTLSLLESQLIARYRIFSQIVKFVAPYPTASDAARQSAFTGHVIVLPHNGPDQCASQLPNTKDIHQVVIVMFIGTAAQWSSKNIRSSLLKRFRKIFDVRPAVVRQWLIALKQVGNPFYTNISIPDETDQTWENMLQIPHSILERANVLTDPMSYEMEMSTASDIAKVRHHPTENQLFPLASTAASSSLRPRPGTDLNQFQSLQCHADSQSEDSSIPFAGRSAAADAASEDNPYDSLDTVFITGSNEVVSLQRSLQQSSFSFNAVEHSTAAGEFFLKVKEAVSRSPDSSQNIDIGLAVHHDDNRQALGSRKHSDHRDDHMHDHDAKDQLQGGRHPGPMLVAITNTSLLNEYSENDHIFLGSFPHLFFLGRKFVSSSLPRNLREKLFQQHDCRFAQNEQLLFLAFNQLQRHTASMKVAVQVRSNPRSVEQFSKLMNEPNMEMRLKAAAAAPESKDAQRLLRQILPLVRVAGGTIPFSSSERQQAMPKLYAYTRLFGLPSFFLTISPKDYDQPLAIRMILNPNNLKQWMKTVTPHSELESESDATQRILNFSLPTQNERAIMIARNPVAAASVFKRIMESVTKCLFGLAPFHLRRRSPIAALHTRPSGVLGLVTAYFFVFEVQGRGTLHTHGVVWTNLSPALLQDAAEFEPLTQVLSEAIDQICIASLPQHMYDEQAKRKAEGLTHIVGSLTACPEPSITHASDHEVPENVPPHNCISGPDSCPNKFNLHYQRIAAEVNMHKHLKTCRKGNHGRFGCRMGMPQATRGAPTGPVQLSRQWIDEPAGSADSEAKLKLHETQSTIIQKSIDDTPGTSYSISTNASTGSEALLFTSTLTAASACVAEPPRGKSQWQLVSEPVVSRINMTASQHVHSRSHNSNYQFEDIGNRSLRSPALNLMHDLNRAQQVSPVICWELHRPLEQDTKLVAFNPAITAAVACNTALYLLGSMFQAKAILMYLLKYMTKDSAALVNCLTAVAEARRHVAKYPSKASNSGAPVRTGQHTLTRLLNNLSCKQETSAAMAAAALLNMPSTFSSHDVWICFIWPAIKAVRITRHIKRNAAAAVPDAVRVDRRHDHAYGDAEPAARETKSRFSSSEVAALFGFSESESDTDTDHDHDYDRKRVDRSCSASSSDIDSSESEGADKTGLTQKDQTESDTAESNHRTCIPTSKNKLGAQFMDNLQDFGDRLLNDEDRHANANTDSFAPISHDSKGKVITMQQHEHYHYRGKRLASLSFFEWVAIIQVVRIKSNRSASMIASESEELNRRAESQLSAAVGASESDDSSTESDSESDRELTSNEHSTQSESKKRSGNKRLPNWQENQTYRFSRHHPMYDTHQQQIRTNHIVPVLSMPSPPMWPKENMRQTRRDKQIRKFARYILLLLVPWQSDELTSQVTSTRALHAQRCGTMTADIDGTTRRARQVAAHQGRETYLKANPEFPSLNVRLNFGHMDSNCETFEGIDFHSMHLVYGPPFRLNYSNFETIFGAYQRSTDDILQSRYQFMRNLSHGFKVDHEAKILLTAFRNRAATRWKPDSTVTVVGYNHMQDPSRPMGYDSDLDIDRGDLDSEGDEFTLDNRIDQSLLRELRNEALLNDVECNPWIMNQDLTIDRNALKDDTRLQRVYFNIVNYLFLNVLIKGGRSNNDDNDPSRNSEAAAADLDSEESNVQNQVELQVDVAAAATLPAWHNNYMHDQFNRSSADVFRYYDPIFISNVFQELKSDDIDGEPGETGNSVQSDNRYGSLETVHAAAAAAHSQTTTSSSTSTLGPIVTDLDRHVAATIEGPGSDFNRDHDHCSSSYNYQGQTLSAESEARIRQQLAIEELNEQQLLNDHSVSLSSLNSRQREALECACKWMDQTDRWKEDPSHVAAPEPLFMLIHGGAGVGKSTFARALIQSAVHKNGRSKVICAAPTGIAATLLTRGRTLHGLLNIRPFQQNTARGQIRLESMLHCSTSKVIAQRRFSNKSILLIDEISMVGSVLFALVDQRLREIHCGNNGEPSPLPFGGMGVIVMGDFFQLSPVGDISLPNAVLNASQELQESESNAAAAVGNAKKVSMERVIKEAQSLSKTGGNLFKEFKLFQFTEQMRVSSADVTHTSLVAQFQTFTNNPCRDPAVLQRLRSKVLTAADCARDPSWMDATMIVPTNKQRRFLQFPRILAFAKQRNEPILRWHYTTMVSKGLQPMDEQAREYLYQQYPGLTGMFVKGAPVFLTTNLNPSRGIANGTSAIQYSLSWKSREYTEQIKAMYEAAAPGEVIDVETPFAVNVLVPNTNNTKFNASAAAPVSDDREQNYGVHNGNRSCNDSQTGSGYESGSLTVCPSLLDGKTVIPLRCNVKETVRFKYGMATKTFNQFPYEFAFVVTFHKCQGRTIEKAILDLNHLPGRSTLDYSSLYVGISRVRRGVDIRLFPFLTPDDENALNHIRRFHPNNNLQRWLQGFDSNRPNRAWALPSIPLRDGIGTQAVWKRTNRQKLDSEMRKQLSAAATESTTARTTRIDPRIQTSEFDPTYGIAPLTVTTRSTLSSNANTLATANVHSQTSTASDRFYQIEQDLVERSRIEDLDVIERSRCKRRHRQRKVHQKRDHINGCDSSNCLTYCTCNRPRESNPSELPGSTHGQMIQPEKKSRKRRRQIKPRLTCPSSADGESVSNSDYYYCDHEEDQTATSSNTSALDSHVECAAPVAIRSQTVTVAASYSTELEKIFHNRTPASGANRPIRRTALPTRLRDDKLY